jgi:hypothetical protein
MHVSVCTNVIQLGAEELTVDNLDNSLLLIKLGGPVPC